MNINFLKYNTIAFKQNNPQPKELHGFRNISNLHCAICGSEMMQQYKKDEILSQFYSSGGDSMKSPQAIEVFKKTIPFLPPEEVTVLNFMEDYSKKYPDKSFHEIFLIPEIKAHHAEKADKKYRAYQQSCEKAFGKIEDLLPDLNTEQQMHFDFFKLHATCIGYCKKPNELKKYLLKHEVDKLAENIHLEDDALISQIKALTSEMPLVPTDADKLLYFFMGKSDSSILQSLLRNRSITVRHLDKGTKTNPYKMFCLCERCNTNTGGIPFSDLFKILKDLPENMKKYSVDVIGHIMHGDISLPKDYPQRFQQIINLYSDKKITLPNITDIVKVKTSVSNVRVTPESKMKFLSRFPKIKAVLDKNETYLEQNLRIMDLKKRLKEMCLSPNPPQAQIADYKFCIKLLEEKLQETAERYRRSK